MTASIYPVLHYRDLVLTDPDYGSRDFAARDPEGNVWCLGTYRPSD